MIGNAYLMSTNWKVITEKQNIIQIVKEQCWISRSSEGQDASCWWNIVCEYEVNLSTYDKVISEIPNFNAKW